MPLGRKIPVTILLSGIITLMVASAVICTFRWVCTHRLVLHDMNAQAEILTVNSTRALFLEDRRAAGQILAPLKTKKYFLSATLYLSDGRVLAHCGIPGKDAPRFGDFHERLDFEGWNLRLLKTVFLKGKAVGSISLLYDFGGAQRDSLQAYGAMLLAVFFAFLVLALVLSSLLRTVVLKPIFQLAETARAVAHQKDYSVRVRKYDQDELGLLTEAFNQMLTEIQRQNEALRQSEERFRTLFENATIGLYRALPDGEFVIANPALIHLLGCNSLPELNELRASRDFGNRAGRNVFLEALTQSGGLSGIETKWTTRDASIVFVRESAHVIRGPAGEVQFFEGTVEDITANKRAEAELESLHQQLADASRQAGMAEMATGVLHNIGNVLNTVNVSTTLVADRLRSSRMASLAKVVRMLDQHGTDLGSFLTETEKGRQVPAFLGSLAKVLTQEQARLLKELESLRKNVEHMKGIVAMQQNYARVSGANEVATLKDLAEDALKFHAGGMSRLGIRVVREFEVVPRMLVCRHKVLLILVNLIRNAQFALGASGNTDRVLTIRVGKEGEVAKIQVIDNGIGIPPENLTRIFEHGFTTRKGGHGFGLHSGALAAKEMGGSLTAESGGVGAGAVFTLTIPIRVPGQSPTLISCRNGFTPLGESVAIHDISVG